ncbi:MAG: DUF488 domain-containing protein [Acidimicrobiia bacterium]
MRVHTIGHGTLPADEFTGLLRDRDVDHAVDIRSYPGSRHNPQYRRTEMQRWLPEAGIAYTWDERLGGRRKGTTPSRHPALRHPAFRAYADYMETDAFRAGVDDLLIVAAQDTVVVMCSESVWWRCHRRLLADHLVLVHGVDVLHIMHTGTVTEHPPLAEARVEEGNVVYDGGTLGL